MASPPEAVACRRHPQEQTVLRCGRCGDPICPRCMIHAPVGIRCPRCVTWERKPVYEVSTPLLLRASGAGLGTALVGGLAWGVLSAILFLGFLSLLVGAGLGYLIGLAVSLSANRKRARPLQFVAGGNAALAFLVATALNPLLGITSPVGVLAAVLAVVVAVSAVR